MGNQISSVFPNGDIHDSETQQQFLYSIDSQNPKKAQPVSAELLDFNKQTSNFVLFTYGQMDYVHYWQCSNIFVAAFTAPKCPIPERSYHFHTFKGMPFITIRCNENCYQVMNHFMDHVRSSITRTEFLNKVISEINSQNTNDLQENKITVGFNEAPQIRRASPSKKKRDDNNSVSSSLAPSLASIKRNLQPDKDNKNNLIGTPTKKHQKVSIQLPTLEDSPRYANTIEMITYDSVNISTSFTTNEKNVSDNEEEEEEEPNNNKKSINKKRKPKRKKAKVASNKANELLESDDESDEDANNHEMLSEYSEEENERENAQSSPKGKRTSPKVKQMRSKNKILTQNQETGSVQSKLDNHSLSFANGSDAAKSVTLAKKNTLKKKKTTKKSKKLLKGKKKTKKDINTDNKIMASPKSDENKLTQNLQNDQQNEPLDVNKNAAFNDYPIQSRDINDNGSFNKKDINSNNNIISNNKAKNRSNNKNTNELSNYNDDDINDNYNLNTTNNSNNKNNDAIINRSNLNSLDKNSNSNLNNKKIYNDFGNSNDINKLGNYSSKDNNINGNYKHNANKNTNNINENEGDIPKNFQRTKNNMSDNNYTNFGINSNNNRNTNQTNSPNNNFNRYTKNNSSPHNNNSVYGSKKINSKGKQTPIDANSNSSYTEEEDGEEVVKINLKFTNTQENSNKREPFKKFSDSNDDNTSSEKELEREEGNKYEPKERNLIQPLVTPSFQISESTGVSLPKGSNEPVQISNSIVHSKLPKDKKLTNKKEKPNLHFSLSNPLEVCKPDEKNSAIIPSNQSIPSKMQVAHLVEISKFDKPKPKIEIGHIVDISLPETDSNTKKKKPEKEKPISQQAQERSPKIQQKNINNNYLPENDNSDYEYEYFTVIDGKKNQQLPQIPPNQNEPLVAILTGQPLAKRKRRRHHHHRKNKQNEKDNGDYDFQNDDYDDEYDDTRGRKHRIRRRHHHYNNNNNEDENDYRKNNQKHRSPDHRHHHRNQSRRPRKNSINDYDDYGDNFNDYYGDNCTPGKGGKRNSYNQNYQPFNEKVDASIQKNQTRTVATSTSFFDKETKQSQTRESILNRQREKEIEANLIQKRASKSTYANISENDISKNLQRNKKMADETIPNENKIISQSSNKDETHHQINKAETVIPTNSNSKNLQKNQNKRSHTDNDRKESEKLTPQNNKNNENQSKHQQKVASKPQNKNNNNEYDDYNYTDNDEENENENSQKAQENPSKKEAANSTIENSGFSAALNTISGLENNQTPTQNKITSRFIKTNNNNQSTNSNISRIDDSTDGSLIQKLLPTNQQQTEKEKQQQHILQKTKIFPLPENKDTSLFEEEEDDDIDEELDENQSSNGNNDNIREEEENYLTGTINDDDEFVVKNRSSSSSSKNSQASKTKKLEGQIKQIENIEPIASKSSEVSQFDIFNSDKDKKDRNSSSSSSKKKKNKQICLKKFDNQNKQESDKFNEFLGSTGTTSSEIGDLDNMAKRNVVSDSSSSSSRNNRRKNSSAFSSEFEPKKKDSDFTSNAFEAFSTDSSQNYPSFNEISEKIQASLISYDSLKT